MLLQSRTLLAAPKPTTPPGASKPAAQPRGEKTPSQGGPNVGKHLVFVLDPDGKPLTPTTPARARKLLAGGVAEKVWSKFGTFGIRLRAATRRETPRVALGVDHGTKFEGYAVVADRENSLNVKLDLPDKKKVLKKLEERRTLRRARRQRKCRRRPCRSQNRGRRDFLAPSQKVLIDSRLKVLGELCRIYPVTVAGVEDVKFDHAAQRWGANFSTIEIGKARLRRFYLDHGINATEYEGHETQEIRKGFGYRKISDKGADRFESHCCDSLALACAVGTGEAIEPGPFLVIDDTYRAVRRRLHDTQPATGGVRHAYSTGVVAGLRKGILIGTGRGPGRLCGTSNGSFRYHDKDGRRQTVKAVRWISSSFIVRVGGGASPVA
ncbi:MAG: RRXRR domain-containing protein [Planctomycetaceae bacterium]|nr:RRXRR domain-containing protein [Planctomycetaceae bacterium]